MRKLARIGFILLSMRYAAYHQIKWISFRLAESVSFAAYYPSRPCMSIFANLHLLLRRVLQGRMFLFIGFMMIMFQGGYVRRLQPGSQRKCALRVSSFVVRII